MNFVKFYRTLANSLTITRLFLILPILISLSYENLLLFWILFIIGGLTDILDGILARKSNTTSSWGAKYDPFADKILIISPLIWLVSKEILPYWSVVLILARDLFITNTRMNDLSGKPAIPLAKLKTVLLFISILLLTIPCCYMSISQINYTSNIAIIFYWISFLISFYTALKYSIDK